MLRSWLIFLLASLMLGSAADAQIGGERRMDVQLRLESPKVAPGGSVALAFVMKPKAGWHGYWQNPGDAGVANRPEWRMPPGWSAEPLSYPVPTRLIVAGLMNYVYERDHALLTRIRVPADAQPGKTVPIAVRLDYLVCTDEVCVPERAELNASIDVAAGAPEARSAEFDAVREALPRPLGAVASFERTGGKLRLAIPLPASVEVADP